MLRTTRRSFSSRLPGTRNRRYSPCFCGEFLESRCVLAVFPVTSGFDIGLPGELRDAINQANVSPGPDLIPIMVPAITLQLGQLPVIQESVVIDGLASGGTVQIMAAPNARIFEIDDGNGVFDQLVQMTELELSGGDMSSDVGGAILNREDLVLDRIHALNNRANMGGAIANFGQLNMDQCTLDSNRAFLAGGALTNAGSAAAFLRNSQIASNLAAGMIPGSAAGGGIHNIGGALLVLDHSTVVANEALGAPGLPANGGGIANFLFGRVELIESNVLENHADDFGGGIFAVDDASLMIQLNSQVFANIADDSGGGLYLDRRVHADILDSTISGNLTEKRGGGISAGSDVTLNLQNATIADNSTYLTMRDGAGGGLFLSGFGTPNGPHVDIRDSLILKNNRDPANIPSGEFGGGIHAESGVQLTIDNTDIRENMASRQGGGIQAASVGTTAGPLITITNSRIDSNESLGSGGGIFGGRAVQLSLEDSRVGANRASDYGGGLFLSAVGAGYMNQTVIRRSTITGNRVDSPTGTGGGINAGPGVDLRIERSQITDNSTYGRGGGAYLTGLNLLAFPHTTTIQSSVISGNRALSYLPPPPTPSDAYGGGIFVGFGAQVDISTTTISNNLADRIGGGMLVAETNSFTLRDSTVSHNRADRGGGARFATATATLSQTTFAYNTASGFGGAISVYSQLPIPVTISHSTISKNRAGGGGGPADGGGIFHDSAIGNVGLIQLDHTIVSNNVDLDPTVPSPDLLDGPGLAGNPPIDARFSFIGINSGTVFPPGNPDPNGNKIGTILTPLDPLLGPLQNNGGPTRTMQLLPGSLAIDMGDPTFVGPPAQDQRQAPYTRVYNGIIDMGAVESQPDVDFNDDGSADCLDVDLLVQQIVSMLHPVAFDLTGDNLVNLADLQRWLDDAPEFNGKNIQYYLPGDANLDGSVDASDFSIWNANKFTLTAAWCAGDFNADGVIDATDYNIWNSHKFTSSPPSPRGVVLPPIAANDATLSRRGDRPHGEYAPSLERESETWPAAQRADVVDRAFASGITAIPPRFQANAAGLAGPSRWSNPMAPFATTGSQLTRPSSSAVSWATSTASWYSHEQFESGENRILSMAMRR